MAYANFAIEGAIEAGDAARLQQLMTAWIEKYPNYSQGWRRSPFPPLNVSSSGGDLREAMEIGFLLRKFSVDAYVMGSGCYSSCVFILAGAVERQFSGSVGVHRPYFGEVIDDESVHTEYARTRSAVRSYFEQMNVPLDFADFMFSVPPEEIVVLSAEQLEMYLPRFDPAHEAVLVNKFAKKYGVSASTFRSRKVFAEQECVNRFEVDSDRLSCEEAVLNGVSRQVYLEWQSACQELDVTTHAEYDNTGIRRLYFNDCPIPKPWSK